MMEHPHQELQQLQQHVAQVEDHRILLTWSAVSSNDTNHLPIDMRFNEGHMLSIVVYSILMVFSAIGNVTVLVLILRRRRKTPSRINTALMHLAIADLLVTFLMMPLEIGWACTVSWKAGDAMCRIMAFFRMFGLYLSSFVLVCISMDRYYAVLKPLHLNGVDRRGKVMLFAAWMGATICSTPQTFIFHVEAHPNITWYKQCITYNVLPSHTHEVIYSVFGTIMMYTFPLIVIIYTYAAILLEIVRRSRNATGADRIRRSSLGFLGRAKIRTLKMTIIIVLVFFVCWTPYHVMMLWYWYDRDSAINVDQRIQRGLFLFACTNSCMNPIVYGAFNIRARRTAGTAQADLNTSHYYRGDSARLHPGAVLTTPADYNRDGASCEDSGTNVICLASWKRVNSNNGSQRGGCSTTRSVRRNNITIQFGDVKGGENNDGDVRNGRGDVCFN